VFVEAVKLKRNFLLNCNSYVRAQFLRNRGASDFGIEMAKNVKAANSCAREVIEVKSKVCTCCLRLLHLRIEAYGIAQNVKCMLYVHYMRAQLQT